MNIIKLYIIHSSSTTIRNNNTLMKCYSLVNSSFTLIPNDNFNKYSLLINNIILSVKKN